MLQLMTIEYHASDVVQRKELIRAASDWIDEHVREDAQLDAIVREKPERVNLLHDLLDSDEPTATQQAAALKFAEIVDRYASEVSTGQAATAAVELAHGIRELAEGRDVLYLTLA